MKRRQALELIGFGTLGTMGALLSKYTPAQADSLGISSAEFYNSIQQQSPIFTLASSLLQEYDYEAQVEGSIPQALQGTLYRNGPGLFDRGNLRKRNLLDGDGMIQAFRIQNGKVHYQNRFVRTEKYQKEAAANQFLYDTWSIVASPDVRIGASPGQAGVTVFSRNGKLYAFDDIGPSWELNPETLETTGAANFSLPEQIPISFKAHPKIDGKTGEWILFAFSPGFSTYFIVTLNPDGSFKHQQAVNMPRRPYIHDFFVSKRHVIFNLHPVTFDAQQVAQGKSSLIDTFQWQPEQGNLLVVVNRDSNSEPIQLPIDGAWMWHILNAYETKSEIIADFIGYDNPDHFFGSDPILANIMRGQQSVPKFPGTIRRYIINLKQKTVRQEIIDRGSHELPSINQQFVGYPYRYGYLLNNTEGAGFLGATAIKRIDMRTGVSQVYDFGDSFYCLEPVFIPRPGLNYSANHGHEPGWVLTEVLDRRTKLGALAIFEAESLAQGPIAIARLTHPIPFNFHGYWQESV
ncbi:MAG: carotenoid oxygenase family protein [Rhizonema sp. PD37]|nr:carotenoid oxygenase family protein [Rhizonema sp. PD37]